MTAAKRTAAQRAERRAIAERCVEIRTNAEAEARAIWREVQRRVRWDGKDREELARLWYGITQKNAERQREVGMVCKLAELVKTMLPRVPRKTREGRALAVAGGAFVEAARWYGEEVRAVADALGAIRAENVETMMGVKVERGAK